MGTQQEKVQKVGFFYTFLTFKYGQRTTVTCMSIVSVLSFLWGRGGGGGG